MSMIVELAMLPLDVPADAGAALAVVSVAGMGCILARASCKAESGPRNA